MFFREVGATRTGSSSGGFSILLLHGAYSSSDVWVKTKTLQLLAALGYRTIAVDLPGMQFTWLSLNGQILWHTDELSTYSKTLLTLTSVGVRKKFAVNMC